MSVVGIIAEYNPFHNGHLFHMNEAFRVSGAGRVVVVMSGSFTQRGEPALIDKHSRAEAALRCGASMVIELPAAFACAGAETFARGGICLLHDTGIVDYVCFGAETNNPAFLEAVAEILAGEPPGFKAALREGLDGGMSFARARSAAIQSVLDKSYPGLCPGCLNASEIPEALRSPNNILAVEYLSAIRRFAPELLPLIVPRIGPGHNKMLAESRIASASYIRKLISRDGKSAARRLLELVPPEAYTALERGVENPGGDINKYSHVLHYILLNEKFKCNIKNDEYLDKTLQEHTSLWKRITKAACDNAPISEIVDAASGKRHTKSRIRRVIVRHLIGIPPEESPALFRPAYVRVLGFRRRDEDLLSLLMKRSKLPVVTNLKNAEASLSASACARRMFDTDRFAQELFRISYRGLKDEASIPMVIV